MFHLGLTPSKQSSDEKVNRNSITKQENSIVRFTLVE
ncbi:hypothetical protein ACULLB_16815 [Enterococcus gallinarum]|nr:hypothetical protein [Enterococcus faecalis]MCO5541991.1 hypothetical protein [Enterococcus faecalis]